MEPAEEEVPDEQVTHWDEEASPVDPEYVPAGQGVASMDPAQYEPMGQIVQVLELLRE